MSTWTRPHGYTNPLTSTRYQRARKQFLRAHPLCAGPDSLCQREGRTSAASELDHIVPRFKDRERDVFDVTNWQGLCHACHREKSFRERGARVPQRIGHDGFPVTSSERE